MKKTLITLAAAAVFGVSSLAAQDSLVAGWNFNNVSDAPTSQMVVSHGAGTMTTNWANLGDTTGSTINAVSGDTAGRDIGFLNGGTTGNPANEGNWFQFEIDMTGAVDLHLSYAGRTTATGMRTLTWAWSVNGSDFTDISSVDHVALLGSAVYGLVELDLSGITALNNQAQVFIRGTITSQAGQTNQTSAGNTRIDNVQFRTNVPTAPGIVTLSNVTGGSVYSGTTIFTPGSTQSVALAVSGPDSTALTTVEISLPEDWSGLSLGNVGLSGSAFSSANPSVSGDTLTISNANVTEFSSGTVILNNVTTPSGAAIANWGSSTFTVRTAVTGEPLDNIGSQPRGNVVIPISQVRQVNAQGIPLSAGQRVAVNGVATVGSGMFSTTRFSTYLQDETGGVALDNPDITAIWFLATQGNRYTALGIVDQFRGLTQIAIPDSADNQDGFIDHGPDVAPEPLVVTIDQYLADAENLEGTLIRINRVSKVSGTWLAGSDHGNLTVIAAGGSSTLTLLANRFAVFGSEPTWPRDVVGIANQFTSDTSPPFLDGYQILPRSDSDFLPPSDPEDGAGSATLVNATGGSPFEGTTIFASGTQQSVSLTITGEDPASLESVSITLPDGWSGLALGNVGLSGTGFGSANPSVSGDTLTITGAALTGSASGTVIISNVTTPAEEAIVNYGVSPFNVKTALAGGTRTEIALQPQANLIIPISLIRAVNAQGVPLSLGETVAITGVATVDYGVLHGSRLELYVQDETAGVALFHSTDAFAANGVVAGNRYIVIGTVAQFNGLTQIEPGVPANLIDLGADVMPEPQLVTIAQLLADAENIEGSLVRIARVSRTGTAWPAAGGTSNITINDESGGSMTMRIVGSTDIGGNVEPDWPLDLVGIVGQFDSSSPFLSGYQIFPRAFSDFLPASDPAGGFAQWQADFFPGGGPDSEPGADASGDGLKNLLVFALGGNPHEDSRHLLPELSIDGGFLKLTFRRVKDATDVVYSVEAASELSDWTEIWNSGDHPYTSPDEVIEETVFDTVAMAGAGSRFLRLVVTLVE